MILKVAKCYKDLVLGDKREYWVASGRTGGKSKAASQIVLMYMMSPKKLDGVVNRATLGSLSSSTYNEIISTFTEVLDGPTLKRFKFKKNPLSIVRDDGATIYFLGIGGSEERTKSFKPLNKIGFVINEELQELKTKVEYDQAMASLRRNLNNDDFKVINLFNPPAIKLHWVNVIFEEKKRDKKVECIHTTYLDVLEFLNDYDLREIRMFKKNNFDYYNWLYLGNPSGGNGMVYPMFKDNMILNDSQFRQIMVSGLRVVACVIGIDGAVTTDETVCVPILVFENGQTIVVDNFIHNPKENAVIGFHTLCEQYIKKWFDELCEKYNLNGTTYYQNVPIYMRCDCAAADFVAELRLFFGARCDVQGVRKGSVFDMSAKVQNAMSNDMLYVLDVGYTYNYYQKRKVAHKIHPLVEEIGMLCWDANLTGYDPRIPNDRTDALTYGCYFYFGNIENMSYFNVLLNQNRQVKKFKDILGLDKD